ncbi:arylsulfatase A-like enzyme [Dyadobacter jejuensis]|uniref:Arylsulfatase A-like enzyme n=1 Tax=Dyadobacter jejuensis TaxID=1082580 RepID=A0A316AJD3_9BACT|nr:sulfatase-like hydrolase/transferase [Dyadobacter jejuensis]PWJ57863.1 arylsulfatase A-like enzyme [Dyadobacter jejuensis]
MIKTQKYNSTGILSLMVGVVLCLTQGAVIAQTLERPNIVMVLADDMRWDYLAAMKANNLVKTPNLDALAAEGTLFSNAFVTSAICTPSRTSILTGMYERKHGVTFGSKSVMTEEAFANTYPMLLRKNGYYTGWVGKNHTPIGKTEKGVGYKSGVMDASFDYWQAGHGHLTFYPKKNHSIFKNAEANNQIDIIQETIDGFMNADVAEQTAHRFLHTRPKDQPFCLMVNFNVPHSSSTNSMKQLSDDPELYRSAYRDQMAQLEPPADYIPYEGIKTPKLPKRVYNGEYLNSYAWVKTEEALKENQIRTLQTVTGMDLVVGNLVEELKKQGVFDNTIIVFTSDHGLFHGEYGLGGKTFLYDIDLKVPLIIYAPGISKRKVVEELCLNIDIAPTLLDFAGIAIPEGMQGRSLKPLLQKTDKKWRKDFFSENMFMQQNYPRTEAVRTKDWKYIRYFDKAKDQHHVLSLIAPILGEEPIYEELYHLKTDPYERNNVAGQPANQTILESLRKRCALLLTEAKGDAELPPTYIEDMDNEKLRDSVEVAYKRLKTLMSQSKKDK